MISGGGTRFALVACEGHFALWIQHSPEARSANLDTSDAAYPSLEEALRNEKPFLIQIERRVTSLSRDGSHIQTWYRRRLLENLSNVTLPSLLQMPLDIGVPPELQPLSSDSLLIWET